MSYYLQIKNIKGDVTTKGYENTIALHSLQFGLGRKIHTHVGKTSDREYTLPKVQDIVVSKFVDKSSPYLLQHSFTGELLGDVSIILSSTNDSSNKYLQYKLRDTVISKYDIDGTPEDEHHGVPVETLHLNFTKLEMTYIPRDSKNSALSPITTGYDIETATKL